MKILAKSVAVAAIAMSMTGVAEARILNIGDNTTSGSEFVLNVVNYDKLVSFTVDLGFMVEQMYNDPSQSLSFNVNDGNFQSFLSSYAVGDNVKWGVNAGYNLNFNTPDEFLFGFWTTSATNTPSSIDPDAAQISNTMGVWDRMVGDLNTLDAISDNNSAFRTSNDQGYTGVMGDDFQGALPFAAQGDLGAALAFVHEKVNADDFDTGELDVFANVWKLDLNGSLTYGAATTTVPVPGAVWMFGAGLMGLLGVNRRKAVTA